MIFSRSVNGLQTLLDKTKVMIFNNCGKSINNYSFKHGVNKLNNVRSYKYLGMTLNISLAREELKKSWA